LQGVDYVNKRIILFVSIVTCFLMISVSMIQAIQPTAENNMINIFDKNQDEAPRLYFVIGIGYIITQEWTGWYTIFLFISFISEAMKTGFYIKRGGMINCSGMNRDWFFGLQPRYDFLPGLVIGIWLEYDD